MKLLFLCTGNSCRSQMAEGWARKLGPDWVQVQSAGIEAHGKNPRVIAVMAEVGVDVASQESTQITEEMLQAVDLVITVCGHADEHCPTLPAGTREQHWPLDDPAKAKGDEQDVLAVFRDSRDDIKRRVEGLLNDLVERHTNENSR